MRILVANFFPAFHPPRSGGEQRYYYLYHYLSRHYDVTLLSPTYSNHTFEVVTFSPTFREHRVPKDEVFDQLHWKLGVEGIGPECSGYVVSLAAAVETQFSCRFDALVSDADLIIHESPFTLPYDRTLGIDGKARIYNAYNVEHRLAAHILRGETGRNAVEFIRFLEQSLAGFATVLFATCEEDRDLFSSEFGVDPKQIALAPNGFEPEDAETADAAPADRGRREIYAVFMGSAHPPNVEAARFIVERLAPALPEVEFRLIGAVCGHLPKILPRNVTNLGFLEEDVKRRQLADCRAALNPLFSGSGTNLKMLDYMAAGAPILTTPIGARGLALKHGVDAFIAESEHYGDALRAIVRDRPSAMVVGATAKLKAFAECTWEKIAESMRRVIDSVDLHPIPSPGAVTKRPQLLVVNDFPVSQATGGGQARIRELLTELGREFDVRLLCLTQALQRVDRVLAAGVKEMCIPKTAEHRAAEVRAGRETKISINDIIASDFCSRNPELLSTFRVHVDRSVAVVFEHPYLAPLLDYVPIGTRVVYSSHNIEADLKAALLVLRRDAARQIERVSSLEKRLLDRADLIVCVSNLDRAYFRRSHPDKRYEVIENGARTELGRETSTASFALADDPMRGRPLAVFLGSAHMPNVEAANFLIKSVAPAVPEVTFGIIGSVCDAIALAPRPRNLVLFGVLPEAEKNALLARAAFAMNPLSEGGGSSLKVPDFLAAGLPLVSTRVGVRGFALRDGEHFLEAERGEFVAKLHALAGDNALRSRLATNARAFAETNLDWRFLGARYRRALRSLIAPNSKRRVLVVTYRFADPPPGGAEAFLVNMLRELAKRGQLAIDVATCDVGAITNKWHFSATYAKPQCRTRDPAFIGAIHRFAVDVARPGDFDRCSRLFSVWMAESIAHATLLAQEYEHPLLLGGWNFPETYAGKTARWASREAQIHVGKRVKAISLAGFAPQNTRVEILRAGKQVASRAVNGRFDWTLELPGDGPVVTLRTVNVFATRADPRELGVVINELSVHDGDRYFSLNLAEDFATAARRLAPDRWVRSLIAITERRDRTDDGLFNAVRGPHSAELDRWLEDNVGSYDVVLAQGVPFSTPVRATEIARRQEVPIVLLPHFHMEDRYYHWRMYYDAFRSADCVIASPARAKPAFFDELGATSVLVPGGGVDPLEYDEQHLARCKRSFRALHLGPKPFVLVLGRKAAGKNYQMAIDAVQAINRDDCRVEVVLIGPDDDGIEVSAPHTYYYAAQPRDIVLGALSLALCLVNMSESESFGIVLLEAWFAGRPVVAQRKCMAFSDLIVSGQNGFLAESPAEVAQAIDRYLADEGLAVQHAHVGKLIAERYSWTNVANSIERILLHVVQARSTETRVGNL